MQSPPETITTPLVVLRRAGPADGEALFQHARDPEVMRFMDWPIPAEARHTEAHLEAAVVEWEKGSEYQWIILERRTGECAGTIACRPKGHAADFGYFLGRQYWGRGLASEAGEAIVSWLAGRPEILRIWAATDIENARSRRLLERLGLKLEGVLRMASIRPNIGGPPRDTAIYARTRS